MRIIKHPLQNQPGQTRLKIIYNSREKHIKYCGQHLLGGAYYGSQLTGYPTGGLCCSSNCGSSGPCNPETCICSNNN